MLFGSSENVVAAPMAMARPPTSLPTVLVASSSSSRAGSLSSTRTYADRVWLPVSRRALLDAKRRGAVRHAMFTRASDGSDGDDASRPDDGVGYEEYGRVRR